jgi:hypothetical protein
MNNELNKNCNDKDENNCNCGHDHENEGCNCGHDHNHEDCDCGHDEDFVIDLEDDNGNLVSCPVIDTFEFEGNEYLLAQSPEDDSVYMFKTVGEELVVPEEEEFNKVATYYNEELVEK